MIEFINVSKNYNSHTAVSNLNLKINKGEFFALLGPNGAGKTTTISMLSALTPPSSGIIKVGGSIVDRNNMGVKAALGIVSQHFNMSWELTAIQNLEVHARLFAMPAKYRKHRIDKLLNYFDLYSRKDDMIKDFSGGMKKQIMIARALLHEPEVLLLDEPTAGLDATVRRSLWDRLKELNNKGLTVLLTTHYMEEAEILCQRIGFMDSGSLVALDTPKNLIAKAGRFVLECFDNGETKTYFFNDRKKAEQKSKGMNSDSNIRNSNLEDIFISLTDNKIRSIR